LQAIFTNRMLREGTAFFSAAEIAERLDFYGAWLDLSVSGSHAFVTLYSLNKYLEPTLDVLHSMLTEPTFPEKELGIIVANNLQQYYISLKKTDALARRAFLKMLFGADHPYGKSADEADYKQVTPDMLRAFFKDFYHSHNCTVFISGKVTDHCLQMLTERFGNASFGIGEDRPASRTFVAQTSSEKSAFIEQADAPQSSVRMGMLTLGCHHPDFLKMRVLYTIFGGYFGSRLMSNIREEKGYTYGISAGIVPYPTDTMFLISAEAAPEYVKPLIQEVYHEIDKLQQDLIGPEELSMVQNYMIGELCRGYESAFSWADAWIYTHTLDLPDDHFSEFFTSIKSITPEEVRDLACRCLCKENLKEVVSGKKMS